MYNVWWKRLSDGALVPAGEYAEREEAIAKAQEPIALWPEVAAIIVTDDAGKEIFSTASDDA